jgi:hypothetical protein
MDTFALSRAPAIPCLRISLASRLRSGGKNVNGRPRFSVFSIFYSPLSGNILKNNQTMSWLNWSRMIRVIASWQLSLSATQNLGIRRSWRLQRLKRNFRVRDGLQRNTLD